MKLSRTKKFLGGSSILILFCSFSPLFFISPSAFAGAAASSSFQATEAANFMTGKGGSAVDAACAAAFVLTVTQGYFTGIGGAGFMVIQKNGSNAEFVNFRERAPTGTRGDHFVKDGKPIESWDERNTGGFSVGVPGLLAGCALAHKRYGKLTWKELFEPAVYLARNGFEISQWYQTRLDEVWSRVSIFDFTKSVFGGATGKGLKKGEKLVQPALAETLEKVAIGGAQEFYTGKLAKEWLKAANTLGAKITENDLKSYKATIQNPIAFEYLGMVGETADLPSAAGLMVGGVLRNFDRILKIKKNKNWAADSAERFIVMIETLRAYATFRNEYIADPRRAKTFFPGFYGSILEKNLWKEVDTKVAARLAKLENALKQKKEAQTLERGVLKTGADVAAHTAHVSVIDDNGLSVAMTSTVDAIMGSGITVPGFGFVLNSGLGDFDAEPHRINSASANMAPRSNMSPTLLRANKNKNAPTLAVIGAAGGPLIPVSIVQFLENYYRYGMSAEQAHRFARVQVKDKEEDAIILENNAAPALIEALGQAGYTVEMTDNVRSVLEVVARKNKSAPWEASSDPRFDGKAEVVAPSK